MEAPESWTCPQCHRRFRRMARWVALSFSLPRRVTDPRITRKPIAYGGLIYHVVNLRGPEDVDQAVLSWLTESYAAIP